MDKFQLLREVIEYWYLVLGFLIILAVWKKCAPAVKKGMTTAVKPFRESSAVDDDAIQACGDVLGMEKRLASPQHHE